MPLEEALILKPTLSLNLLNIPQNLVPKYSPVPYPELRKQFKGVFDDPELIFDTVKSSPVVIGGTKSKLMDLLVNTEFIGKFISNQKILIFLHFLICRD